MIWHEQMDAHITLEMQWSHSCCCETFTVVLASLVWFCADWHISCWKTGRTCSKLTCRPLRPLRVTAAIRAALRGDLGGNYFKKKKKKEKVQQTAGRWCFNGGFNLLRGRCTRWPGIVIAFFFLLHCDWTFLWVQLCLRCKNWLFVAKLLYFCSFVFFILTTSSNHSTNKRNIAS